MDIYFLDKNFRSIDVVDSYESFLWVIRYDGYGDFEIYTFASNDILAVAQQDYYLWIADSDRMMIIDERIIQSDIESGDHLTIRGRSLEFILDRRIVWTQTVLSGNFQNEIERLLNENIINPAIAARKIPNFIFERSTDPRITSLKVDAQRTGTSVYEVVQELCKERNLGWKVILNDKNQFVFSLYMGVDRSYSQTENPYVVFSPEFDNIINSNYLESNATLKTSALIAGEGEGVDRRTAEIGGGSGLERRELYVDARDISSNTGEGEEPITDAQYIAQLEARGRQYMAENIFIQTFEGDVETSQMFVYGRDFDLGDLVQVQNEFEIGSPVRIDEMIFSDDKEGSTIVPTFSVVTE